MTSLRDFIPLQKLGEGSFSTVYKVKRISDGKLYALKKVRMNSLKEKERDNAVNEIRILASLQSPYIIGYKEAIYDEKLNLLCIVMEYADGGDLQKKIAQAQRQKAFIVERQIWKAIVNVLKGLQILHAKGILHRDLKSANVFLSDGCYKLGDLNVSKVNKGRLAYTQTGTPYYASPEVWRDEPYDSKSDIWSFGCIIYEMAALKPPFAGRDMESLYRNIQRCTYDHIPNCYSRDLETVIGLCMQKNPKLRPSSSELLNNPIVQKYAERLQMGKELDQPDQKKELLRTIKVPLGLKGLQKNLPKSNYQQTSEKEIHKQYEQYISHSPRQQQLKNISMPVDRQQQNLSNKRERQLSPRLSPKLSPRNKYDDHSAKILLQVHSHEKPFIQKNRSERLVESDVKRYQSSRREAQIRQLQKSLLTKQQEIEDYVNSQLKRPLMSAVVKIEPQRGPIKIYGRNEQRRYNLETNLNEYPQQQQVRTSKKRQVDYSSSRNNKSREFINSDPYIAIENKRKAESEGNVSHKKLQYEISKELNRRENYINSVNKNVSDMTNKRDDYANLLNKNASSIIKQSNNKMERRNVRPDTGKYRPNIMPSWWG